MSHLLMIRLLVECLPPVVQYVPSDGQGRDDAPCL